MTLIDFGDFKLRFDPKEVRISIDGEMIDVGARREEREQYEDNTYYLYNNKGVLGKDIKRQLNQK